MLCVRGTLRRETRANLAWHDNLKFETISRAPSEERARMNGSSECESYTVDHLCKRLPLCYISRVGQSETPSNFAERNHTHSAAHHAACLIALSELKPTNE